MQRMATKMSKTYRGISPRMLNVAHGEGKMLESSVAAMPLSSSGRGSEEEDAQDSWIVAYAFRYTEASTGNAPTMVLVERYVKLEGRWLFLCRENSIPTNGPFEEFVRLYFNEDAETGPEGLDGSDAADEAPLFGDAWRKKAGKRSDGSDWTYLFEMV